VTLSRWIGLVVLGGVLAGPAGCAVNPVTGQSELMLLSEEEEVQLGAKAFEPLAWQNGGPLRTEPAAQAYLAGIVKRLHEVSHRPNLPVDFTLHSASEPNAWAIPGHTAMHRGLLQHLENEAQFAFVMGHEMAHVAARHSAKRQSYGVVGQTGLGILGAVFDAAGASGLGSLVVGGASVGTQLVLLKYDRGQELQADQLGVLYMARAGYEPEEAIRSHQVLNEAIDRYLANVGKRRGDPGALDEILSTHPRHEARVAEIRDYIRALPAGERRPAGDGRFTERWLDQTASIRALAPAYARYDRARAAFAKDDLATAEREIAEAMRLADQAQFSTLQGAILLKQGRSTEARQAFNRAVAAYPGYQPALKGLALVGR
jgi:predicted Zn-dependent protease